MHLTAEDDGFTLIEVLVAIAILGVITVPLADVIIDAMTTTVTASDQFVLSHDAQISAAFFAQDVAAVGRRDYSGTRTSTGTVPFVASIQEDAAYDAGGETCGTTVTETTRPALIRFLSDDWNTTVSPPVVSTDVVAYYLVPAGAVAELHRMKCVGGASAPVSDVVVAHNVDPGTSVVTCSSPCGAAAVPWRVTLAFSVTKGSSGPYAITLTGQRRQS